MPRLIRGLGGEERRDRERRGRGEGRNRREGDERGERGEEGGGKRGERKGERREEEGRYSGSECKVRSASANMLKDTQTYSHGSHCPVMTTAYTETRPRFGQLPECHSLISIETGRATITCRMHREIRSIVP